MNRRIAYIDDSTSNLDCLRLIFRDHSLEAFQDPDAFLASLASASYDTILVDLHMPKVSGFTLCEQILENPGHNGCPIIFISSDDSDLARIRSFQLGAVDFLNRETSPEEMLARVESKILFYRKHRSLIEFDSLRVNLTLLKTYLDGVEIPLTFIELKLLCLVLRSFPELILREEVAELIWQEGRAVDTILYTHLSNLNSKLRDWDHEVRSVKGRGIQLVRKGEPL